MDLPKAKLFGHKPLKITGHKSLATLNAAHFEHWGGNHFSWAANSSSRHSSHWLPVSHLWLSEAPTAKAKQNKNYNLFWHILLLLNTNFWSAFWKLKSEPEAAALPAPPPPMQYLTAGLIALCGRQSRFLTQVDT